MISSPDNAASRSSFADWIELRAIIYGGSGQASIAGAERFNSDYLRERERDDASNEMVEEEILESQLEARIAAVSDEIAFRMDALGDVYPFEVKLSPRRIKLKATLEDLGLPEQLYIFMLLMTGGRDKICALPAEKQHLGRTLFHVCASYGVAGLIRGGKTYWFGHPRPAQIGFLDALQELCCQMGWGNAKTAVPPGLPELPKDDGVDIVGWRLFGDRRVSGLVILCQAATGSDWEGKSITTCLSSFLDWFDSRPYCCATPSLAVPFPAHHEVTEPQDSSYELAVHNALYRLQGKLGVILDRLRIVEGVRDAASDSATVGRTAGAEKLPELRTWVSETVKAVAESA